MQFVIEIHVITYTNLMCDAGWDNTPVRHQVHHNRVLHVPAAHTSTGVEGKKVTSDLGLKLWDTVFSFIFIMYKLPHRNKLEICNKNGV